MMGSGRGGEQGGFGGAGRGEVSTRVPNVPLHWYLIQAMAQRQQFMSKVELVARGKFVAEPSQQQEEAWVLRTRNR